MTQETRNKLMAAKIKQHAMNTAANSMIGCGCMIPFMIIGMLIFMSIVMGACNP